MADLFARLQLVGAFLVGILLLAVPLYLWRRPRAAVGVAHAEATATPEVVRDAGASAPAAVVDAGPPPPVRLTEARVLECHDPGSKKTLPEQCDHILVFEKAFADAVEAAHDCVPADAGTGSIEYVADLSFARKHSPITVSLPKDGRSFTSPKIIAGCAAGVRARLTTLPVTSLEHAHARYKVAFIASYAGTPAP